MQNSFIGIENFFWNIFHRIHLKDFLDIVLVAFLIYKLLLLTKNTRASQVLKGFVLLIIMNYVSKLLGFAGLNWILKNILNNGAIVLMILFQPEIRSTLEHLGRNTHMNKQSSNSDEGETIINEITHALISLSRRKVGALIVFEKNTGLQDTIETGTRLDSIISSSLIVNIFEPNTPLHDGAVVVKNKRIAAAACILPLTEQTELSKDLGTRHRAGIGASENSDALVMIVSEETGIISYASNGKLTRNLDANSINSVLQEIFIDNANNPLSKLKKSIDSAIDKTFRRKRDAK